MVRVRTVLLGSVLVGVPAGAQGCSDNDAAPTSSRSPDGGLEGGAGGTDAGTGGAGRPGAGGAGKPGVGGAGKPGVGGAGKPGTGASSESWTGTATTTRYWDCSGGAAGCGYQPDSTPIMCSSNAMFAAPTNSNGAAYYGTAALSSMLGGTDWPMDSGLCFLIQNVSGGELLVLRGTNYCPPSNTVCNNAAHFDIAAPGYDYPGTSEYNVCRNMPDTGGLVPPQACAYSDPESGDASCCDAVSDPVLQQGCKHFSALQWNNVTVNYRAVDCPEELLEIPCSTSGVWPTSSESACSEIDVP